MKKLTDEELDSIFKTAAEGLEPPFEAAAWEGMSAKLNSPSPSLFNKWLLLSFLGLVIFSGGVWVGLSLNADSKKVEEPSLETMTVEIEEASKSDLKASNGSLSAQQEKIKSNDSELLEPSNQTESEIKTNQNPKTEQARINNQIGDREEITKSDLAGNENVVDKKDQEKPQVSYSDTQRVANDSNLLISEDDVSQDSLQGSKIESKAQLDSVATSVAEESKEENKFTRALFIRGLASPDFSSINFGSSTTVGSNYALLIEYQFSKRWSISTGAIRSVKKYSYDKEITYSGYKADKLDGACRILDVPLNVYYQLKPSSKTSFFAGAGLSSYIMLSEEYTYTVFTKYGDRLYETQVERKNNEWFKVLNLSIGIQHRFGSRFYLQAEPFIKAPLAGVGEGDVLLSSLGIFFGLKYKLN